MEIIPFNYKETTIRVVEINNEPYFVARDVAKVLNIKDSKGAIRDLKNKFSENDISLEGVFLTHPLNTKGGVQNFTLISELALYEIIFSSRKKEAVLFRYWVTSEVLPSIRKTGSYSVVEQPKELTSSQIVEEVGNALKIVKSIIDLKPFEMFLMEHYLGEKAPFKKLGIDLSDVFLLPTELGKLIGKSAVEVNILLAQKGYQVKVNGVWQLTEKGRDFGIEFYGRFLQIKWKAGSL